MSLGGPHRSVKFGFVPLDLYEEINSYNWQTRVNALEKLKHRVETLSDVLAVKPHISAFTRFLGRCLGDADFKISFTSIQILDCSINKFGYNFRPHIGKLMPQLLEKLGDRKKGVVLHSAVMKAVNRMMQVLTPEPVLSEVVLHLDNSNPRVTEEIVNIAISGLLSFPPSDFDFELLMEYFAPLLNAERSVKRTALEAFAVMYSLLGRKFYELAEKHVHSRESLQLVRERCRDGRFAVLNADGIVEHSSRAGQEEGPGAVVGSNPDPADVDFVWRDHRGEDRRPRRAKSAVETNSSSRLPWEEPEEHRTVHDIDELLFEPESFARVEGMPHSPITRPHVAQLRHKDRRSDSQLLLRDTDMSKPGLFETWSSPTEWQQQPKSGRHKTAQGRVSYSQPMKASEWLYDSSETNGSSNKSKRNSNGELFESGSSFGSRGDTHSAASYSTQLQQRIDSSRRMEAKSRREKNRDQQGHRPLPPPLDGDYEYPVSPSAAASPSSRRLGHGTLKRLGSFDSSRGDLDRAFNDTASARGGSLPASGGTFEIPRRAPPSKGRRAAPHNPVEDPSLTASAGKPPRQSMPSPKTREDDFGFSTQYSTMGSPPRHNGARKSGSTRSARRRAEQAQLQQTFDCGGSVAGRERPLPPAPAVEHVPGKGRSAKNRADGRRQTSAKDGAERGASRSGRAQDEAELFGEGDQPWTDERPLRPSKETRTSAKDRTDERPLRPSKETRTSAKDRTDERPLRPSKETRTSAKDRTDERPLRPSKETRTSAKDRTDERPLRTSAQGERKSSDGRPSRRPAPSRESKRSSGRVEEYSEGVAALARSSTSVVSTASMHSTDSRVSELRRANSGVLGEAEVAGGLAEMGTPRPLMASRSLPDLDTSRASTAATPAKTKKRQKSAASTPGSPGALFPHMTDDHVEEEDLPPVPHPDRTLTEVCRDYEHAGWERQVEMLNTVRALCQHEPALVKSRMRDVIQVLSTGTDNLRSQVAHAGLLAYRSLFYSVGRPVEAHLKDVVSHLMKRAGQSDKFLKADANTALLAMTTSVSPSKAILALEPHASSRNPAVAAATAQALMNVSKHAGARVFSCREAGKLLHMLVALTQDASAEARDAARRAWYWIAEQTGDSFQPSLAKVLNDREVKVAVASVEKGAAAEVLGDIPASSPSFRRQRSVASTAKKRRTPSGKRSTKTPEELNDVPDLLDDLTSSDWRKRKAAIAALCDLVSRHPVAVAQQPYVNQIFDAFAPRMSDGNANVRACALRAMEDIVPIVGDGLAPALVVLVPELAGCLATSSSAVKDTAASVLDLMTTSLDPLLLVQPFVKQIEYGNSVVKVKMIDYLGCIVDDVVSLRRSDATHYILPLAFSLVSDSGPGVKGASERLLVTLHDSMGDDLLQAAGSLTPRSQAFVERCCG